MNMHQIPRRVVVIVPPLSGFDATVYAATVEGPLEAIRSTTETVIAALNDEPDVRSDPAQLRTCSVLLREYSGQHIEYRLLKHVRNGDQALVRNDDERWRKQ